MAIQKATYLGRTCPLVRFQRDRAEHTLDVLAGARLAAGSTARRCRDNASLSLRAGPGSSIDVCDGPVLTVTRLTPGQRWKRPELCYSGGAG